MGCRVKGLGLRVEGYRHRVYDLGLRIKGLGLRLIVQELGFLGFGV